MGVVVELPAALRPELKEPLGPIYTDAGALVRDAGRPLVAVGDVVTYHIVRAGEPPDVALVDGRTKRDAVDEEIAAGIGGFDREMRVENPPATVTDDLLSALAAALERARDGESTLVVVDGEEDLAALPAVLAVPEGGSVVYGQPDEGMVLVAADPTARERVRGLVDRMDGDGERLRRLLDDR
ncbi:DUF359 domain-containing protein [Halobacteriales archaeon QS_1_68_17]|nr:MAG: DUF359 domain-containing protein [Halobacteriales archaeon QS_1_68_17]